MHTANADALSSHALLAITEYVAKTAPWAKRLVILPEGEHSQGIDQAIVVNQRYGALHVDEHPMADCTYENIPYGAEGVLTIQYMYRDASNYKQHATHAIRGPFSREDLGILLGALTCGDDGGFVPHQIGMEDLQTQAGWELTDESDHIWHEITRLSWGTASEGIARAWGDVKASVIARLTQGYDVVEAHEVLSRSFADGEDEDDGGW